MALDLDQRFGQSSRLDPVCLFIGISCLDITQQNRNSGFVFCCRMPLLNGFAGTLWPVTASNLGNSKQRPPVIAFAVIDSRRQQLRTIDSLDLVGMVVTPAGRFPCQHVEMPGSISIE